MTTVDSHTHIISADRVRYARTEPGEAVAEAVSTLPVSIDGLVGEMERARVDHALVVQYNGVYGTDNSYVVDSARQHPTRASSVCIIDVLAPEAAATLRALVENQGVRGIRLFQTRQDPDASWIDDARTAGVWDCARDLRIPVVVFVRSDTLKRLRPVLERYPEVQVAFDHLGSFGSNPSEIVPAELLALSDLPSVFAKLSTVNLYRAAESERTAKECFGALFERFGASRVMWGSNYPNTRDRSYPEMVDFARGALSFLSEDDQNWVFGASALRLWPELG